MVGFPFIVIDGVGAAESSYSLMAWFTRPSFSPESRLEARIRYISIQSL
jgi:hypothetical protein